jgi:hypothetical protein
MVRAGLRSCRALAKVTRGRWVLGKPSGYAPAPLPSAEALDYRERPHKDRRRPWARDESSVADTGHIFDRPK